MTTFAHEEIKISGSFVFESFNTAKLASIICASHVQNNLLNALYWPESDLEYETYPHGYCGQIAERNKTRLVSSQLRRTLSPECQGPQQQFEFCLFSHKQSFSQTYGYQDAMRLVVSKGYVCSTLAWFLSFMLQASEQLKYFNIAAPVSVTDGEGLYPCFDSKSKTFDFDWNEGDMFSDFELISMNTSLLFGVKRYQCSK